MVLVADSAPRKPSGRAESRCVGAIACGSLAGGVTQLATLTNKPTLQANDFVVI
jgi:hypothetical protein